MKPNSTTQLEPFDEKKGEWRVVIETPKGSHNKYKFDEELASYQLHGVLPEGMSFPYDFGFLPSTVAEDGDPLDVLLLMDQPAFCGCLVPSRLIGVIEAEQTETDGKSARNDRLVAVPTTSRVYSDCASLEDLNPHRLKEIEEFFVSYNRINGKQFKVLNVSGPERAEKLARDGMKQRTKSKK
ncbi:MAG: inorganic diphosphatase [Phycisphaerales bacterium]|nr:inorganic diphosphatase [Phycisphaerales bacterium]